MARDARSPRASGWWGTNRLLFTQACRKDFLRGMTWKGACTLSVDFDRQIKHPENPIEPAFGTNMQ